MPLDSTATAGLSFEARAAHCEQDEPSQTRFEEIAIERTFSIRSIIAGGAVGALICFASLYYGLQSGNTNSMPLPSVLLVFAMFSPFSKHIRTPLTPNENVMAMTVAASMGGIPYTAGLCGVIPALEFLLPIRDNGPVNFDIPRLILWCLSVCLFGIVVAVPLRKHFVLRSSLKFPTGTASKSALTPSSLDGDLIWDTMCEVLRFAIREKQTEAVVMIHDFMSKNVDRADDYSEIGFAEDYYHVMMKVAAVTDDIATFRTVIHLAAVNFAPIRKEWSAVMISKTCDRGHEDLVWFTLKWALLELEGKIKPHRADIAEYEERKFYLRLESTVRLVSFIVAHYMPILEKTCSPIFEETSSSGHTFIEAVTTGNPDQVRVLLQQFYYGTTANASRETVTNDDLWKAEWWLRHKGYNAHVFEQFKDDATNLGGGKDTLIMMYLLYKMWNDPHGRAKTRLRQLTKHVERDSQFKTRVREWAGTVDRNIQWLEKAKSIAIANNRILISLRLRRWAVQYRQFRGDFDGWPHPHRHIFYPSDEDLDVPYSNTINRSRFRSLYLL